MSRVAVRMTNDSESDSEQDSESELEDHAGLKIRKLPVVGILLVELCERLTYYTLAGTQKIYLQNQLKKTPSTSAALNSVFSMLCDFWCVPGGLLADSIGRYKTIIAAGSIYAIGTICVGISVIYELQASLGWLFMLGSLVLIAMGTGGIKPNIANFGADQIGDVSEKQRVSKNFLFPLLPVHQHWCLDSFWLPDQHNHSWACWCGSTAGGVFFCLWIWGRLHDSGSIDLCGFHRIIYNAPRKRIGTCPALDSVPILFCVEWRRLEGCNVSCGLPLPSFVLHCDTG